MNCDEFRERFHLLLDERKVELTDREMMAHIALCTECAEFQRELMAVDDGLRRLALLPVPAPLVESFREIGAPHDLPSPSWMPDVGRAAAYLAPGLLLWGAQWAFPENVHPAFLAAITFIAGFTFVTSILRPRILGSPGR